jgi:uncharacterized membrane protein
MRVKGDSWELVGEAHRRRGVPARAARSQAILDATGGRARPGEVCVAPLRSDWRIALDWKHPGSRAAVPRTSLWQGESTGDEEGAVDWYLPLKLVHVLSAIVAVGTNITYFVWLAVMRDRSPVEQSFALGTIRRLDARLANPAYTVLPITGVVMVLISDALAFTAFWILAAIVLYAAVGVLAGVFFAPSLRRLIAVVEGEGASSSTYEAAMRRTRATGLVTMIPVAAILSLMVMKPTP